MIQIVTDSSADLSPDFKSHSQVSVVPLNVMFGERAFKDGVDITSAQFYEKLRAAPDLPTTSMPAPADFADTYRNLLERAETIVSIHISSKLSGTYQSAVGAMAEFPEHDIVVIDSGYVSVGLHLLVALCLREAEKGTARDDLLKKLDEWKRSLGMYFTVDTLDYLMRGGRIGKASHLIGSVLNIKPILTMSEGAIDTAAKARSRKKALAKMKELMTARPSTPKVAVIAHAAAEDARDKFSADIATTFEGIEIVRTEMGPVNGTHAGPGAISLAFI